MAELSEYELQRLAHVKRNHEMLIRLGLVTEDDKPVFGMSESKAAKPRAKRVALPAVAPETLRRSGRVKGTVPDYTHAVIDAFGDDDREVGNNPGKRKREESTDDDEDDERAEVLERTARECANAL